MSAAACSSEDVAGGGGFDGAFPNPREFCHKATTITTELKGNEFSGGDFRQSTCSHFVINDAKWLREYQVIVEEDSDGEGTTTTTLSMEEIATHRIRGFSGDYEGICLYEEKDSPMKLAIIDEGNRTAALCEIPSPGFTIDLESEMCVSYSLSPEVLSNVTLFNPSANRGFEGVACDPEDQKLYIAQEKEPMAIWQLDLVTGEYEVLIPVSSLQPWNELVEDIAGIAFDPINRTLYVLSEDSKVVVESTLEGEIVGSPLDVSQANQPEGIYFAPSRGELWIASEPNELLLFKADDKCSSGPSSIGSSGANSIGSSSATVSMLSSFLFIVVGLLRHR